MSPVRNPIFLRDRRGGAIKPRTAWTQAVGGPRRDL